MRQLDDPTIIGEPTVDLESLLKYTKETIITPELWTKGAWARSPVNRKCKVTHTRACKFCLHGGLDYAYWKLGGRVLDNMPVYRANGIVYRKARLLLVHAIDCPECHMSLIQWNDRADTTHDDIRYVLDTAIENAGHPDTVEYITNFVMTGGINVSYPHQPISL